MLHTRIARFDVMTIVALFGKKNLETKQALNQTSHKDKKH